MEKANSTAIKESGIVDQLSVLPKALDASSMPCIPLSARLGSYTVVIITRAVSVQITTVSINGSIKPTNPSVAGSLVRTAECAIAAEPMPASLENAARWNPMIIMPSMPPPMAVGLNASVTIAVIAQGNFSALRAITSKEPTTYIRAMNGTSLLTTLAILLIPPMMTKPTVTARAIPNNQPLS